MNTNSSVVRLTFAAFPLLRDPVLEPVGQRGRHLLPEMLVVLGRLLAMNEHGDDVRVRIAHHGEPVLWPRRRPSVTPPFRLHEPARVPRAPLESGQWCLVARAFGTHARKWYVESKGEGILAQRFLC